MTDQFPITSAQHPFNRVGFLAESIGSRHDPVSGTEARAIAEAMLDDPIQAAIVEAYVLLVESAVDRLETADAEPLYDTANQLADFIALHDHCGSTRHQRTVARILTETLKRGLERANAPSREAGPETPGMTRIKREVERTARDQDSRR